MRHLEYTVNEMKDNLKKNKRIMIIIFLSFIIFGIATGAMQAFNQSPTKYSLDDTIVEIIDLDNNVKDETYYYNVYCDIKNKYSALDAYVQYLKQVDLSDVFAKRLFLFEEDLSDFKQNYYDEMRNYYIFNTPIICDNTIKAEQFAKDNIEQCERKIADGDKTINLLNNHSFSKVFITTTESKLYEQIQSVENEKEFWDRQLDMIHSTDLDKIGTVNNEMDRLLQNVEETLNELVYLFNDFIVEMEGHEQYDIIYNKYLLKSYLTVAGVTGELSEEDIMNNRKNNAIIYARSMAGLDTTKERFFAFITFFMLVGAAVAILYGAFWNGRKNNIDCIKRDERK